MRKAAKKRANYGMPPKVPMLVARGIQESSLELKERYAVEAFVMGVANQEHFFLLQDVLNLLLVAGQSSDTRRYALERAEQKYKPVLISIQERHAKTGKFGVSSAELLALRDMINFNRAFWVRQSSELFIVCHAETKAFYVENAKQRALA